MNPVLARKSVTIAILAVVSASIGCRERKEAAADHADTHSTAAPSNRIDLPEAVRRNLGITFARVENRRVTATLRVPGRFELPMSARREYRTVLPARVELLVHQYDRVKAGQVLAKLDSPEWRRVQHEAVEAEGEIRTAEAVLAVAQATAAENEQAVAVLKQRTAALAEANSPRAELTAELTIAQGKAARLAAEVRAAQTRVAEANEHYASRLRVLSSVVDQPVDRLLQPAPTSTTSRPASPEEAPPLWRTINTIDIRARADGVVDLVNITTGGWVESGGMVMAVSDPSAVRFRAAALQSDLTRLKQGTAAQIIPPRSSDPAAKSLNATWQLTTDADPVARTVDLILTAPAGSPWAEVPWARPGVTAFAEIVTSQSDSAEPAIPVAAVVQDELTRIFFRRDPANPDKVIRVEADLGVSDGRWVVVQSGLKVGDEVVLDGVYELKLTGSGKGNGAGGHFHADGTWHANGTPEK